MKNESISYLNLIGAVFIVLFAVLLWSAKYTWYYGSKFQKWMDRDLR